MKTSMKICVVQLTRIGDIIQTYQAAKQLKTENPNIELTLIARKKFSQGLDFLLKDVFTNIIELNTQDFFKSNKDDLQKVHTRLHNFIHDIKKFDFDLVVNLSFNKSSNIFAFSKSQNPNCSSRFVILK